MTNFFILFVFQSTDRHEKANENMERYKNVLIERQVNEMKSKIRQNLTLELSNDLTDINYAKSNIKFEEMEKNMLRKPL